jgi:PAS domain S-box-containing protein
MTQEKIQTTISGGNAGENINSPLGDDIAPFWLSALIDSADDAIISKTLDGIITSWNKGAERIFGYRAEEVIGKPVLILIPPDHYNEEPEILSRIKAGERVEHYETIRVRKDGSLVDISLTISPIRKTDGQIIGASKIARDISALKRTEETLRRSENQLRLITDALPALISYVDREHRYSFVNQAYTGWFGLAPEDFVGKHLRDIIGEAAYAAVLPKMERAFAGEAVEFEQLMPYPEGERNIHVNYVPDFDEATGKVRGFFGLVQDVSESKKAEARLRESEARFAKAFDASPLVLTISSLETGRLLEVNETFVNATGFSREEAIGKTTVELGLWAKPTDREEEMETVRQTGHIRNAEYVFQTRNGEIIGLLSAEHIQIGGESFALTVIQDITERKRAEERLRESEENLRYTVELNPQVAWTANIEGGIESFSDKWLEMTGMRREDAFGEGWSQVPHPDDAAVMQIAWMNSLKTGEPYDIEHRIRLADGAYRWMRSRAFPRRDETGEIIRWYGTTEDIHERKLAEERLRQSGERLQMAMDAAKIYSWELDVATGQIEWSSNLERVLGFSLSNDYETTVNDLIHDEDRRTTARKIERAIENRENFESEFRLVDAATGDAVWVRSQGVLIDDITGDKQPRFVGITQNITERKQAEQEREQLLLREQIARQQAEEASRLKDEFLATVSHEIRTPLNAILGWSQMLMTNKIRPNDMQGAIETIYRNAKSQAQLIEDILDVSRIITGKIRLEPRPISLAPLIQTAVESLRPAIEAKNIRLQMRLDFEPRMVSADPNRLQQVVWNLVSNAIKFTPENGSVSIELESDASRTKIIVSDTGKGIDAEFLPFVFERFRQADGSSTRKHGGLGLGLAIVRHIVELHGGSVEVNSEGADKGTTFTVYLPLAQFPASDTNESVKLDSGETQAGVYDSKIKGLRILLIDDEADTLELLGVILTQSGAEVKSESTAAGGLEILKQWLPDVIISDIAMPVEDGYSFIKKLRTLPPEQGGTIPVIALTAYVGIKERTQILSSGFQMYVPKPIEPSELVGALANFV